MKRLSLVGAFLTIVPLILFATYFLLLNCSSTFIPGMNNWVYELNSKLSYSYQNYFYSIWLFAVACSAIALFGKELPRKNRIISRVCIILCIGLFLIFSVINTSLATARSKPSPAGYTWRFLSGIYETFKTEASSFPSGKEFCGDERVSTRISLIEKMSKNKPTCRASSDQWIIFVEVQNKGGFMCEQSEIWCQDSRGARGIVTEAPVGLSCTGIIAKD